MTTKELEEMVELKAENAELKSYVHQYREWWIACREELDRLRGVAK